MNSNLLEEFLIQEADPLREGLNRIVREGKSLEPYIKYYISIIINSEGVHKPLAEFHDTSLKTSVIFKRAVKELEHPEVTGKSIKKIYSQILSYLTDRYSPSLLLKATTLMHHDLKQILKELKDNKNALQDYVLKRQYYLFLGLLYLELFGSRTTVHLLESFFEKNHEHPYIQLSDYDASPNHFTLFVTKMYQHLIDYGGLTDAMFYHFKPFIYNENVHALRATSLGVGQYHSSTEINNGREVTPADYFIKKEGVFFNRDYFNECFDSIKYMLKSSGEVNSHYIVSPVIKALLMFEAQAEDNSINHKRTTFELLESEDEPKGHLLFAHYYQLGDIYFAQRSYFGDTCRYCEYMYPLTHYATLHIKDLYHPTDKEIETLYNKTKHIFKMGGI